GIALGFAARVRVDELRAATGRRPGPAPRRRWRRRKPARRLRLAAIAAPGLRALARCGAVAPSCAAGCAGLAWSFRHRRHGTRADVSDRTRPVDFAPAAPQHTRPPAQVAELVDALVSGTSG